MELVMLCLAPTGLARSYFKPALGCGVNTGGDNRVQLVTPLPTGWVDSGYNTNWLFYGKLAFSPQLANKNIVIMGLFTNKPRLNTLHSSIH